MWSSDDPVASWEAWLRWLMMERPSSALERAARLLDGLAAVPQRFVDVSGWRRGLAQRRQPVVPRIVLTGDLKAGRSTLLNGLLGRPLLRTAVRGCTPVPVTVFAAGIRWTEVPPGHRPPPSDGRILVVDVRQPLPRSLRLAHHGDGPTVLVLTKLDRARSDAELALDPEAEVTEAVEVACRRARAHTADGLAGKVCCDPRDADAVRSTVWPTVHAALAAARLRAEARRDQEDVRFVEALAECLTPPEPVPWPPHIPIVSAARAVLQAGVSMAMTSMDSDAAAWRARVRHVDDHNELDRLVARVPEALDHIGRRAVDCAMQGCRAAMADWADAVVGRLLAAASWATPPASQAPQVLELGVAGGMLARSAAGRVQAAAPPALLGMVRLRRVEVRRSALEAAWADALSELQIDLGAALRDGLGTVEAALQATAHALTTHMEAAGQEALVAEARCRTAERLATWAARDWLTGETAQRPTVAPLRTL